MLCPVPREDTSGRREILRRGIGLKMRWTGAQGKAEEYGFCLNSEWGWVGTSGDGDDCEHR